MKRASVVVAGVLMLATISPAYYHFVHFAFRNGNLTAIPEKFDLNALVDETIRYYVQETGPEALAENDSFESVISQIRAAGRVWSEVGTSRLRVAFGGLTTAKTRHSSPYIEVMFDEIPPGLLAMGGPTTRADVASSPGGAFVPVTRSVVVLSKDLSNQRSSSEAFFLTVVHELGHALGLQHTLSSSVMSTSITRSTTKADPLAIDDIAGLSLLYPASRFAASTGAIAGRVLLSGNGINLASVVALSPQGPVISALTNPDGTYRIEGIPAGQYYVYVHPLPPPVYGEVSPANIVLPRDADDKPLDVGPLFETQFYPGVKNADSAESLSVKRGEVAGGIDFDLRSRDRIDVYAVTAYSFPGKVAVPQGYLNLTSSRQFLVAAGFGLAADGAPTKGLRASVIGGSASIPSDGLVAYKPDARYLQINIDLNPFSAPGARHLLFALNNDIYVRPSALHLTSGAPPFIDAVAASSDPDGRPAVALAGRNISRQTKILFDGLAGTITGVSDNGVLFVQPPTAPAGHKATVVALNPDGQSSLFLQGTESPTWEYGPRERTAFSITPAALPAGSESMVEIRGSNTAFQPGQTELGFGSTDVAVRGLWVIGPDRVLANVAVASDAEGTLPVTLASGLEVSKQPLTFQVQSRNSVRLNVRTPARDLVTQRVGVFLGKKGFITLSEAPAGIRAPDFELTLNDEAASILSLEDNKLTFDVPASLGQGPAILRLRTSQVVAFPVVINVEVAPPEIVAVTIADSGDKSASGPQPAAQVIDANRPAAQGDLLSLLISGLSDGKTQVDPEAVTVTVGGIQHSVHQLLPVKDRPGFTELQFFLGTNVTPGPAVELTVAVAGRESAPVVIPVIEKK